MIDTTALVGKYRIMIGYYKLESNEGGGMKMVSRNRCQSSIPFSSYMFDVTFLISEKSGQPGKFGHYVSQGKSFDLQESRP